MRIRVRAEIAGMADQRRIARLERLLRAVKARIVFIDYNHGSVLIRADPCALISVVKELKDLIRRCVFRLTLFIRPSLSVREMCSEIVKVSSDLERCITGRTKNTILIADISKSRDYARVIVLKNIPSGVIDLGSPALLSPTEFPCDDLPDIINEISGMLPVCRVE